MQKNPISFCFIIVSPVYSIKPLSKDITSILKLFYEKVEIYHTKEKVWSGIKTFWTIQNSYPVISSINKLNKWVIGILMGSDPAQFFIAFLFFY